ncbi:hypothetical protein LJR030_003101 [Rhizobium sp. LjRoot30]|uniref:CsgG/HfaB family protein n=1 Tax=Rhizobium sp. LjRoot30 TaxID=3342320 RepID=UPI003ECD2666
MFRKLMLCSVAVLLTGCATANKDTNLKTSDAATAFYKNTGMVKDTERLSYLEHLPARKKPIRIAVYEIPDQTGKNRPNDSYADYSRAVTQGAEALVIQALTDVGNGKWFDVVERRFVERVLNERTLAERSYLDAQQRSFQLEQNREKLTYSREIRIAQREADTLQDELREKELARATVVSTAKAKLAQMGRAIEEAQKQGNAALVQQLTSDQRRFGSDVDASIAAQDTDIQKLKDRFEMAQRDLLRMKEAAPVDEAFVASSVPAAMPYVQTANYIITGSIVDYSSNVETGGAGLGLLNVRAQDEIRRDMVTISLRLVDSRTSRILTTSTVTKSLFSRKTQIGGAGYVTLHSVLEGEAGVAVNEPGVFALTRAIDLALANIVEDAQKKGVW